MSAVSKIIQYSDDLRALVRSSSVTGGGTLSASNGVLKANSPGIDDRAWAYINVYAPRGSKVKITCEARQGTSTSQGRISVDQHPDDNSVGGNNVDYVQMEDTNWRPYSLEIAGDHKNPFLSVTFGVWNAGVGSAEFRNIKVVVYNTSAPNPEYRACMIRGQGNSWTFDDGPGRFVNIGCHSIVLGTDHIQVHWDPMQTWQRPIVHAQMDQAGGRAGYYTSVSGGEKHFCRVYIVRASDGAVINPSAVSGDMFIGVSAVAL